MNLSIKELLAMESDKNILILTSRFEDNKNLSNQSLKSNENVSCLCCSDTSDTLSTIPSCKCKDNVSNQNSLNNKLYKGSSVIIKGAKFTLSELNLENASVLKNSYLSLLKQLTSIEQLSIFTFLNLVRIISSRGIIPILLDEKGNIVAAATLLVEQKIARGGSKVGHIEDVVVDSKYRGFGLGKIVVKACQDYAALNNCYKIILDCTRENVLFYEKCGFKEKEIQMRLDLPNRY